MAQYLAGARGSQVVTTGGPYAETKEADRERAYRRRRRAEFAALAREP